MANYGMKVSKTGYDVKTTTDNNLIATSKKSMWIQYLSNGSSVTVPAESSIAVTITHGLEYAPAFYYFHEVEEGSGVFVTGSVGRYPNTVSEGIYSIDCYAESKITDLILNFGNNSPEDQTIKYKYFIVIDTLQ